MSVIFAILLVPIVDLVMNMAVMTFINFICSIVAFCPS